MCEQAPVHLTRPAGSGFLWRPRLFLCIEAYSPCHGIQAPFRAGHAPGNHTLRTVTPSETAPANVPRRSPELKRVQLEDRPALLASEDPKKYQELDSAVAATWNPATSSKKCLPEMSSTTNGMSHGSAVCAQIFVKTSTRERAEKIIEAAGEICGQHLADGWLRGDPTSAEQVHELLAEHRLNTPGH